MKRTILAITVFGAVMSAAAQVSSNSANTVGSASTAANQGQGNGNQITVNSTSPSDTTLRNVPSVSGPQLTTGSDTCVGSISGSFNVVGLGIGGGSTYIDTNCKRLKNSRELWNMGLRSAAIAILCNDTENREALTLTGYECPVSVRQ